MKRRLFRISCWMAALGAPLNAMAAEPAFVKCRWESGTYPAFLISGNENGGYGIYKIESAAMWGWNSTEWRWAGPQCFTRKFSQGDCTTQVTDSRYVYTDEYSENYGPTNNHGYAMILTIDRTNGSASLYERQYHFFGLSDDGDKQTTKTGTCEKTTDPSLLPKPAPKL